MTESAERGGLPAYFWLWVAALVLNMFSGHSHELHLPIGPDRLCFGAGLLLLLLDPVALKEHALRARPVHLAMVVLTGLAVWSAAQHGTLASSTGFYALLDRLIVPFLFFTFAPVVFGTAQRRDILLRVLVVMGLYLSVTAVIEITGPKQLLFPKYIGDPFIGIHYGRARGPLVESVGDGVVITMCGLAAAWASTQWQARWRLVALVTAAASTLGILLTLTREVWLGAAAALLVVCFVTPALRRWIPLVAVTAVLGVSLALAVVPGLRHAVQDRNSDSRSVFDRRNTNAAALEILKQKPLTGVGWQEFAFVGRNYVRQADNYPITTVTIEVHNVALSRGAELGLPGLGLWLLVTLGTVGGAVFAPARGLEGWKLIFLGSATCWLAGAMLSPLPSPLPNQLIFLMAGIVLTPSLLARQPVSTIAEPQGAL